VEVRILSEAHARAPLTEPVQMGVEPVTGPEELLALAAAIEGVQVRADLPAYVVKLLAATRSSASLSLGASPRAGVMLLRAAKARAALAAREYVTPDDIKTLFLPALRHRVVLDPAEELEGATSDVVLARILESVEVPR
jgi:MoxR-like ATPase